MQDLKLFPTKKNLRKGVVYGVITLAFALVLIVAVPEMFSKALGLICFGLGSYLIWTSVQHLRHPTPVFEADADGFSVRGKAKRPWSEYRGVEVYKLSTGLFSNAKYVRVKVGTSMMGGTIQIGKTLLSGTPEEMAAEISGYAQFIERFGFAPTPAEPEAEAVSPATPPADPTAPAPAEMSFAERLSATNANPVTSVPTLGERVFGRRKDRI